MSKAETMDEIEKNANKTKSEMNERECKYIRPLYKNEAAVIKFITAYFPSLRELVLTLKNKECCMMNDLCF
jgi:hypothetical protein